MYIDPALVLIPIPSKTDLAGQGGFEPTTLGFGDRCSANWSYWPTYALFRLFVGRVLAVEFAILGKLHLAGFKPLVARLAVVSAFADRTL